MKGRDLLIYLAIKYNGTWNDIYAAISRREIVNPQDVIEENAQLTCQTLTILDENYPESFKSVHHPPFVLFYYGDINLLSDYKKNVAVIGSREHSEYGKRMTEKIVKEISGKVNIVSGLARGIDAISHQECLANNGHTIAILGSGIDYCYPKNNQNLYEEIKKNHLLISEYPKRCEPKKENFPERNRLIAACSSAVVVTEAKAKSGTIITVGHMLDLGREVLCVPHRADEASQCNRLIAGGATLVENGEDVLFAIQ
ncbi:MAG TPA: DNA-processing protein DprA [Bacilli bacterium]|nr:DNA-processing protein DprA [Bacilli bacterium]HPS18939.1 DNA-processing protein DprA [Bacilli bacterium]